MFLPLNVSALQRAVETKTANYGGEDIPTGVLQ